MTKALKNIQSTLGIKFTGDKNSFDDVKAYLDEHMDTYRTTLQSLPPSDKQLNGVKLIEDRLGIRFEGTHTRSSVSEFLNAYLDKAINTSPSSSRPEPTVVDDADPFDDPPF